MVELSPFRLRPIDLVAGELKTFLDIPDQGILRHFSIALEQLFDRTGLPHDTSELLPRRLGDWLRKTAVTRGLTGKPPKSAL